MTAPQNIQDKIKFLLNLTTSPNQNEADNARKLADNLISKYNISEAELEEITNAGKPLYGEDDKLYFTIGLVGYKQRLALAIATHFDCLVVQEVQVVFEGEEQFHYYVYGDRNDVENVKWAFHKFDKKIDQFVLDNCVYMLKSDNYKASYAEGMTDSIIANIQLEGIELPDHKQPSRPVKQQEVNEGNKTKLSTIKDKPRPTDKSVDVGSQSMIKNIEGYFTGLKDGRYLSIHEILEDEFDEVDLLGE